MSSAESELYVAAKASAETLGIISMLKDFGYETRGEAWGDASAALGIIHRNGVGKTRHIDTSLLWVQQTAASQRLKYFKVLGKDDLADLYAKYFDREMINHHVDTLNYYFTQGRADEAPKFHLISQSLDDYVSGNQKEAWSWQASASSSKPWENKVAQARRMNKMLNGLARAEIGGNETQQDEWLDERHTRTKDSTIPRRLTQHQHVYRRTDVERGGAAAAATRDTTRMLEHANADNMSEFDFRNGREEVMRRNKGCGQWQRQNYSYKDEEAKMQAIIKNHDLLLGKGRVKGVNTKITWQQKKRVSFARRQSG